MKLQNKVAVITGGASGMGQATALRFLNEGARVVVADYNEQSGKETFALAKDAGYAEKIRFIRTDVAKESDVQAMIACAVSEFGRLDIVFNNAGVGGVIGPVWDIEVGDWDYTFDVLVKGVFLGIKHGSQVMKKQGQGGVIINTASIAGLSGGGGPLAYSAAKAAVINLTKAAAVQLAPDRIRVNAICPGGILTGLTNRGNTEAAVKVLENMQPWPDYGKGEHIAGAALFLASDDSVFVTGEALVVDGGLTALI
jgi:NAD(P)-dependent dehydrogenase (short-subunit alcohol dehydrogenase family)